MSFKKAFSLLELVLVLFIISLIFSLAHINLTPPNKLHAGAKQILNDIAYTRALALMQASFRSHESLVASKDEWFKARWQLYFINSAATNYEQTYTIFLDKNGDGNANIGKKNANVDREIAVDILNPSTLMNSGQSGVISKDDIKANARFNIEKNYNINKIELFKTCSGTRGTATKIIFDELGRLYTPLATATRAFDKIVYPKDEECILRMSDKDGQSLCISINSFSGKANLIQNISYKGKILTCEEL